MRLFRLFRRQKPEAVAKPIVLNEHEQRIFEKIKNKPIVPEKVVVVNRVSRDIHVHGDKCFSMPNGSRLCSLAELMEFAKSLDSEGFKVFVFDRKEDIRGWIRDVFELPLLAEQLAAAQTKQEFLQHLQAYLTPLHAIDEKPVEHTEFNRRLRELLTKFDDVKAAIREARRLGVDTFVSQTKLMNIKSKIDYAEIKKDMDELGTISATLDNIIQELEEEKRYGRTEQ